MKKLSRLAIIILIAFSLSKITNAQSITPSLNHIAVYVYDLKVSTDFYQNIIHLDTVPEPFHDGRHTWFKINGNSCKLHLIQGAKSITAHDKNNHLCFSVGSLREFIAVLNSNHIAFENWLGEPNAVTLRVDGVKQIYFKDPDGYWVEVNDAAE